MTFQSIIFCGTQINVFGECFWCMFLSKQWKFKTFNLLYIMTHAPIRFDVFGTFVLCIHKFIDCFKWTWCFRKLIKWLELWIWMTFIFTQPLCPFQSTVWSKTTESPYFWVWKWVNGFRNVYFQWTIPLTLRVIHSHSSGHHSLWKWAKTTLMITTACHQDLIYP